LIRVDGIFLSDFEQGEIGPDLFRHACKLGLEGLVSKGPALPGRPITALGEGQKPPSSRDVARNGRALLAVIVNS